LQQYTRPHPPNAPKWSYNDQSSNVIYGTEEDAGVSVEEELITESEEVEEVQRGVSSAAESDDENLEE
jgi:hypothetical protein